MADIPGYRPFIISTIVDLEDIMYIAVGYRPFIISTIVDSELLPWYLQWLQAFYNFYYCRYNLSFLIFCGYRPFIISTIVDIAVCFFALVGYRPFIISTIVDCVSIMSNIMLATGLL